MVKTLDFSVKIPSDFTEITCKKLKGLHIYTTHMSVITVLKKDILFRRVLRLGSVQMMEALGYDIELSYVKRK